jgi:predicted AAA+ superfamily ATPase
MKLIFDLCTPRPDVLKGAITESDFAADLAVVIRGDTEPQEYVDPVRFFANTFPTRGLKALLQNVCGRLSSKGGEVAAIFRLDTSFGGGKTHGLIALAHATRGMAGAGSDFESLEKLRRLAFAEQVDEPRQLELWREQEGSAT